MDLNSKILSTAVPILEKRVCSEDIFPKKFYDTDETKYRKYLFFNWRFHKDGSLNDDFTLNRDKYFGKILLVEGSFSPNNYSAESVKALKNYGFEAVVCPKIGLEFSLAATAQNFLSVEVTKTFIKKLINTSLIEPKSLILIDNDSRRIELKDLGVSEKFNQRNISA